MEHCSEGRFFFFCALRFLVCPSNEAVCSRRLFLSVPKPRFVVIIKKNSNNTYLFIA